MTSELHGGSMKVPSVGSSASLVDALRGTEGKLSQRVAGPTAKTSYLSKQVCQHAGLIEVPPGSLGPEDRANFEAQTSASTPALGADTSSRLYDTTRKLYDTSVCRMEILSKSPMSQRLRSMLGALTLSVSLSSSASSTVS